MGVSRPQKHSAISAFLILLTLTRRIKIEGIFKHRNVYFFDSLVGYFHAAVYFRITRFFQSTFLGAKQAIALLLSNIKLSLKALILLLTSKPLKMLRRLLMAEAIALIWLDFLHLIWSAAAVRFP